MSNCADEVCLDNVMLEENYSTPPRRTSIASTSHHLSPSPVRQIEAHYLFAQTWMKFLKSKVQAVRWDPDAAASKMMEWMVPYKQQPYYKELNLQERVLCNRAYQITSFWDDGEIPNLIESSQIPSRTLCDLGYSEPPYTTTAQQNVIAFFSDYWNQTLGVLEEFGSSAITPMVKRRRIDPTCTYSTTALFTEDNAGASSSPDLALFNQLSTVYARNNLGSTTSNVNSSITVKKGNTCIASYLETEERPFQICLRCYKTEDVKGLNNLEKYKKAYVSLTAHVNEHSELHQLVNQMTKVGYRELENQGAKQVTCTRT